VGSTVYPTVRITGTTVTDEKIIKAAWIASERLWKRLGIHVDVVFENAELVDYLAGVGLRAPEMRICSPGNAVSLDIDDSMSLEEIARLIEEEILKSLARSEVEIVAMIPSDRLDDQGVGVEAAAA